MKYFLPTLFLAAAAVTPAAAQLPGNGYYRVQNDITERYAFLTDNKGKLNASATTVDVRAIELWKGFDKACCDPATVLYFTNSSGNQWNITAQGTNLHDIIGYYVNLRKVSDGVYYAYGTTSGATKYLGDADATDSEQGEMSTEAKGDLRKWRITPITADGANYFGVKPTVTAGGKYYQPFFADFPFSASSTGLKFYYISKVEYGMAVLQEINGTVPAKTPVYIECSHPLPTDNRLNLGGSASAISDNLLGGVYFKNETNSHRNVTPYDAATMRLLGNDANGNLAFVTADVQYLPANQAYLKVPAGTDATVRIVTQEEFDSHISLHPVSVTVEPSTLSLYAGNSATLSATVMPADCSDKSVTWTSSNTAVATVSSSGTVTAVAAGSATVTATTVNGLKATCTVSVAPKYPISVTLSPASSSLYETETLQLNATTAPADVEDKTLTWSTSDATLATVDANGLVTGVRAGTVTVTAKSGNGVSGSATVTVKAYYPTAITMSDPSARIRKYESLRLGYNTVPTDVKDRSASWTSSNTAVATVSEDGTVTGINQGTAIITATTPNGVSTSCEVTIVDPLAQSVTLDAEEAYMQIDERRYFTATVLPEDASNKTVTWSSSDENIATVNLLGQVRARAVGECVITAATSNDVKATLRLIVVDKVVAVKGVTVVPGAVSMRETETYTLQAVVIPENATDKHVSWTSDNSAVATVDAEGIVTAHGTGSAIISATAGDYTGVCYVTVVNGSEIVAPVAITLSSEELTLDKGDTLQLTATIDPDDATDKTVFWSSSAPDVAQVSENGLVTALTGGHTVIIATTVNGIGAACAVTVDVPVEAIELDIEDIEIVEGTTFTVLTTILPADATDKSLEWTSDNPNVATVDADGDVTVHATGTAVITARALDGSGVWASCTIHGISGIETIIGDGALCDVYTTDGLLICRNADAAAIARLPRGLYIIAGRKVLLP